MEQETKMVAPDAQPRAAMRDFLCAFEVFKEANDQRLAEIEAKAAADPILTEKVARLDATLDRQQIALDQMRLDAGRTPLAAKAPGAEAKSALSAFMRRGDGNGYEAKSLATDNDGGYLAPESTERAVDRLLAHASPMRAIASVRTVGAGVFKKTVSQTDAVAQWTAETGPRAQTAEPTLELLEFPTGELYAMPAATPALLEDAYVDLEAWIAEEVHEAFALQEGAAFIKGDGVNKPRGFLDYPIVSDAAAGWGEIGAVSTGASGAFAADDPADALIDLIYAPKSGYRTGASFVMNRRTLSVVRKLKDSDGDYVWRPAASAGDRPTIMGYPVVEAEDMPDIGPDAPAIAFGDFAKGYLIVDRAGLSILRDPYSAKPYVLFYTTKRVGGGVQNFDALKVLTFSA
ncbi:MAG: phage major capsid protein [Maricaulaceae bacterium]